MPAAERHLIDLLDDKDALFLVADEGDRVLGFLFATLERVPDDVLPAPRVEIGYVAVRESHRRKGIGTALVREARRWAGERGTHHVALAVWEFNAGAIQLYERLGFQTVERRMLASQSQDVTPAERGLPSRRAVACSGSPVTDTSSLETDGFGVVPGVLGKREVRELEEALSALDEGACGVRRLLEDLEPIRALARSGPIRGLVEPLLGPSCFAVRGILFDKTPRSNWKVGWHQDLAIAVRERRDVEGFGPWSVKAEVPHTLAPASVLSRMLAVRVHLDDCDASNGAVRVLPGTHVSGRLSPTEIQAARDAVPERVCEVPSGGVLLMRPLLLHASSPATRPRRRRVIHLEFASGPLPAGLGWRVAIQ